MMGKSWQEYKKRRSKPKYRKKKYEKVKLKSLFNNKKKILKVFLIITLNFDIIVFDQ
jgi:hypothetical protein